MIHAGAIMQLLVKRHEKDVFIAECKNGPTQSVSNYLRMDAWTMNRSWANPCATAYEIKVSRSDFLRDEKWRGYLPLCNCLYFVTPRGLIKENELPSEVGLMETTSGGGRLITRKKAAYRAVPIPEKLFRYILMCRVQIHNEAPESSARESRLQFWKGWLKERQWTRELGYRVRRELAETVHKIMEESKVLKSENEGLSNIREALSALGIYDGRTAHIWQESLWKDRLKRLQDVVPRDLADDLLRLGKTLSATAEKLTTIGRIDQ